MKKESAILKDNRELMSSELEKISVVQDLDRKVRSHIKNRADVTECDVKGRKSLLRFYDRYAKRYNFEIVRYLKRERGLLTLEFKALIRSEDDLRSFLNLKPRGIVISVNRIEQRSGTTLLVCKLYASCREQL